MKDQKSRSQRRRRQGQGMTEYIIIVGLVAIMLVAAVTRFKGALEGAFDATTNAVNTEITDQLPGNGRSGG